MATSPGWHTQISTERWRSQRKTRVWNCPLPANGGIAQTHHSHSLELGALLTRQLCTSETGLSSVPWWIHVEQLHTQPFSSSETGSKWFHFQAALWQCILAEWNNLLCKRRYWRHTRAWYLSLTEVLLLEPGISLKTTCTCLLIVHPWPWNFVTRHNYTVTALMFWDTLGQLHKLSVDCFHHGKICNVENTGKHYVLYNLPTALISYLTVSARWHEQPNSTASTPLWWTFKNILYKAAVTHSDSESHAVSPLGSTE